VSITNAGFETKAADPAPEGRPDGWTAVTLSSVYDWALYGVDVPSGYEGEARETYDLGWPDEEQYVDALPSPDVLSTLAVYNIEQPTQLLYEPFEVAWEAWRGVVSPPIPVGTAQYAPTLVYTEAAVYDGLAYERFFWSTAPLDFAATDLEFVDYGGAGGVEDFEQGWKDNESYEWTGSWGSAQYADYRRTTPGFNGYEDFYKVATRFLITDVSLSSNNLVCDHSADPLNEGDDVEFVVASSSGVPDDLDYGWDLPKLPSPLRYRHTFYVTDVEADTGIGGVALAPDEADIPLTSKGAGAFYICRSRLTHWVSTLDI
jgi:hypothetical protein